jgi:hypothetical protein
MKKGKERLTKTNKFDCDDVDALKTSGQFGVIKSYFQLQTAFYIPTSSIVSP